MTDKCVQSLRMPKARSESYGGMKRQFIMCMFCYFKALYIHWSVQKIIFNEDMEAHKDWMTRLIDLD